MSSYGVAESHKPFYRKMVAPEAGLKESGQSGVTLYSVDSLTQKETAAEVRKIPNFSKDSPRLESRPPNLCSSTGYTPPW